MRRLRKILVALKSAVRHFEIEIKISRYEQKQIGRKKTLPTSSILTWTTN